MSLRGEDDSDFDEDYEGDLQPLLDELAALREALGESYKEVVGQRESGTTPLDNEDEILALPAPLNKLEALKIALESNQQLQTRLQRLIKSIEKGQDNVQIIREKVKQLAQQRQANAHHPNDKGPIRWTGRVSGVSWFWSLPGAPPIPLYPEHRDVASVTKHLPLVFQRTSWTENEQQSLKEGVLQMVQEKKLNFLIEQIEADANQGKTPTLDDFMERQSPIRSLTVESKAIESCASQFATEVEWNAIAHRSNLNCPGSHCRLQWTNRLRPSLEKEEFCAEEDLLLEELVEKHGKNAWQKVAEELSKINEESNRGQRTPLSCLGRWQQVRHTKRPHIKFTDADIARLNSLVHRHGLSWKLIADEFGGGWDPDQLMHHWRRHDQRSAFSGEAVGPKTGKWTPEEDEALMRALALYGPKWSKVATMVAGRSDVQCRERYVNCLDPTVKKNQKWTTDEDTSLKESVEACLEKFNGQIKWSEVAKKVTGRTDSQCKKRWKVLTASQTRPRKRMRPHLHHNNNDVNNSPTLIVGQESPAITKSRTGRPIKAPTRLK